MILNKDCYERGCAAYDYRVDEGVVLTNGEEHMKAFPNVTNEKGMDLRDYFAAKAMQAQINNPLSIGGDEAHRLIAERAYRMADTMMKAREQRD